VVEKKFKFSLLILPDLLNKFTDNNGIGEELKKDFSFDDISGQLVYGKLSLTMPKGTNQYYLCQVMFSEDVGKGVSWDIIAEKFQGLKNVSLKPDKLHWRQVYDSILAVNQKVKINLGINKLFEYRNKEVFRQR
jgi:hypothetical protein